ncbi:MAG: FAD-binding protein [Eubacteriales bacterium]|nr:FAD-binding protein [Eubacteriales bacterium]
MEKTIVAAGREIPVECFAAVVVGSGAAGLAAAKCLDQMGVENIALLTEHMDCGTSRNAGSDKQTYYKLSLSGREPDSVGAMAEVLHQGIGVDGEHALAEAALSAACFLELADLGVPFPTNRYGEFVGYKTDHDPCQRGSSAGPLTSKEMTEALEREVRRRKIPVFEKLLVIRILKEEKRVKGVLCLDLERTTEERAAFRVFLANQVVYGVGGPAGIYWDSVYPKSQHGASGAAFLAGVKGKNLTEWQYGLASLKPRWNVSGTYMQAIPRMISTAQDGSGEREFLESYLGSRKEALSQVFLKGYQWPFDVRRMEQGSSQIDLAVYEETVKKGRRVFLDYRKNPGKGELKGEELSEEARAYLEKAGALFGTPFERLWHMNRPAVEFYRSKGVDLAKEPLEIALCAQHNNGGLQVDLWWQTELEGFFAVGEAAGTHGVYRPGGSALNAGQVGARRAALFIREKGRKEVPETIGMEEMRQIEEGTAPMANLERRRDGGKTLAGVLEMVRKEMSALAGPVRNVEEMQAYQERLEELCQDFPNYVGTGKRRFRDACLLWDCLVTQKVYLAAMLDYSRNGNGSRGSALYLQGRQILKGSPTFENQVQECWMEPDGKVRCSWRGARPIPEEDGFFENVWRTYRENRNVE